MKKFFLSLLLFSLLIKFSYAGTDQKNIKTRSAHTGWVQKTKSVTEDSTKATIILIADYDIGQEGCGFQMFLDSNHDTYGSVFVPRDFYWSADDGSWNNKLPEEILNRFAYTVPENADGDLFSNNVVRMGRDTIVVPGGVYDYCIILMDNVRNKMMTFTEGEFADNDDFTFEAGYTYIFNIVPTLAYGWEYALPELHIANDAKALAIGIQAGRYNLGMENISFTFCNNGWDTIREYAIYYQLDNGNIITQIGTGEIKPKDTISIALNQALDMSALGSHTIKAWINIPHDLYKPNDSVQFKLKHILPYTLPYAQNFENDVEYKEEWTIINANQDNKTWLYAASFRGISYGSAEIDARDYAITPPIKCNKKQIYFQFQYKMGEAMLALPLDKMSIFYSRTIDTTQFVKLSELKITNKEWQMFNVNLLLPDTGVYYFILKAESGPTNLGIRIDNILADTGSFQGVQDLKIQGIQSSASGCQTDENYLKINLSNVGTAAINGYQVAYSLNGGDWVMTDFNNDTISIGGERNIEISSIPTMSEAKEYHYKVKAICQNDIVDSNNREEVFVYRFEPITELPYHADFSTEAYKEWNPSIAKGWTYIKEKSIYEARQVGTPLISTCIHLTPGDYRYSMNFMCGPFFIFGNMPESFSVLYGKQGTDISTWKPIDSVMNFTTGGVAAIFRQLFKITEEGDYNFAVMPIGLFALPIAGSGSLSISSVNIMQVPDYDLAISSVFSNIVREIPIKHINGDAEFEIRVLNNGKKSLSEIKASLHIQDENIGNTDVTTILAPDSTIKIQIKAKIQGVEEKTQDLSINVRVSMKEVDGYEKDNVYEYKLKITDRIFANENLKPENFSPDGFGFNKSGFVAGSVYELQKIDTLTAVYIGFVSKKTFADSLVELKVYSLKEGLKIDKEVFSKQIKRSAGGSIDKISIPKLALEKGKYFFGIKQLTEKVIGIAHDGNGLGAFYVINDTNSLDFVPGYQMGYGSLLIRAHFLPMRTNIDGFTHNERQFRVYPNPSNAVINIRLSEPPTNTTKILIYDMNARIVSETNISSTETQINTSNLQPGAYIVYIYDGQVVKGMQKLIISK